MSETYIAYNKKNRDEHHFITASNDDECYHHIVNHYDTSKQWVYYSLIYLLKIHKAICDHNDWEYEFMYTDDIKNNQGAFQEVLSLMDKYPTIKGNQDEAFTN